MQPEAVRPQPRNWFAVAGLWTVGATWLGVIAVLFYAEFLDNEPSENIGWTLLGIGTIGFVLTLAGFTVARTRGEWGLAWAALALALAFATLGSPFLFYGLSGVE
jgi:putative Mn2+ efflux pump MntP